MSYVMVLNDGETYTSLSGCKIIFLTDDVVDEEQDDFIMKCAHSNRNIVAEFSTDPATDLPRIDISERMVIK